MTVLIIAIHSTLLPYHCGSGMSLKQYFLIKMLMYNSIINILLLN